MQESQRVLVLGIGNLLLCDEGIGVHAVQALEHEELPPWVDLMDGGTGGFHLLGYLEDYPTLVMIDATMDGKEPGSISVLTPKFAKDFPRTLSAHDIGLKDLMESAAALEKYPKVHLITVTVKDIQSMTMELSEELKPALPKVVAEVKRILHEIGQSLPSA